MNYIQQINAFYDWLMTNPISPNAQCLYLALLHICNKTGWQERFTVANSTLQSITSMSRSALDKQRNFLKQKGIIDYKSGSTRQAGMYIIFDLSLKKTYSETNKSDNSDLSFKKTNLNTNPETNLETNPETNPEHINKLNETKQNNVVVDPLAVLDDFVCETLGRVCSSPLDIEAERKMLIAANGDLDLIRQTVLKTKRAFKPKYNGDKIVAFSYFLPAIEKEMARQRARAVPLPIEGPGDEKTVMTEEEKAKSDKLTQEIFELLPPSLKGVN